TERSLAIAAARGRSASEPVIRIEAPRSCCRRWATCDQGARPHRLHPLPPPAHLPPAVEPPLLDPPPAAGVNADQRPSRLQVQGLEQTLGELAVRRRGGGEGRGA